MAPHIFPKHVQLQRYSFHILHCEDTLVLQEIIESN